MERPEEFEGFERITMQKIESIQISNFKSFDFIDVKLNDLNVVIGPNASGKSNFISIFKFLKDIYQHGLNNAISMQGGIDCLRNITLGASKDMKIQLQLKVQTEPLGYPIYFKKSKKKRKLCSFDVKNLFYLLSIRFYKKKRGYKIREEKIESTFEIHDIVKNRRKEKLAEGRISMVRNEQGRISFSIKPEKLEKEKKLQSDDVFPLIEVARPPISPKEPCFRSILFFSPITNSLNEFLRGLSIYDIDPRLSKRSVVISGKTTLEPDGRNLAVVLKSILEDKEKKRKFFSLIKELLPFIEGAAVTQIEDKSLLAYWREIYCKRKLPASLISDGTINLTALIIALYFQRERLIIIEEPERNIHPSLISKLMDMMRDVSQRQGRQIILTTHNPQVVAHSNIEDLLLLSRGKDGFSKLTKPAEKVEVKEFLKNEIGIEDLFIQDLLGD